MGIDEEKARYLAGMRKHLHYLETHENGCWRQENATMATAYALGVLALSVRDMQAPIHVVVEELEGS